MDTPDFVAMLDWSDQAVSAAIAALALVPPWVVAFCCAMAFVTAIAVFRRRAAAAVEQAAAIRIDYERLRRTFCR